MHKYVRVFLKGKMNRWVEFPLPEGATFLSFMGQVKFEGWAIMADRMVAYDAIALAVEITSTTAPQMQFGQPVAGHA